MIVKNLIEDIISSPNGLTSSAALSKGRVLVYLFIDLNLVLHPGEIHPP